MIYVAMNRMNKLDETIDCKIVHRQIVSEKLLETFVTHTKVPYCNSFR